jgi:hypothetical protein
MWFCGGSCGSMFYYSIIKREKKNFEQFYEVNFGVELEDGATDTYEKVKKAFGNDSVSKCSNISLGERIFKSARKGGKSTAIWTPRLSETKQKRRPYEGSHSLR